MINTTFRLAQEEGACISSYRKMAEYLGGIAKYGRDTPIPLDTVLEVCGLDDALWSLRCTIEDSRAFRIEFACRCAERVLHFYEEKYPDDDRPRKAIEAARVCITDNTSAAWSAESARSAAESATWSAWSAWSAAESAAWSAWSAWSAAESATWSAAWSAWSAAESAAWSAWSAAESAAWSAWSAESAAESATWSAWSAWSAAESATWSAWSAERETQVNIFSQMLSEYKG